ALEEVLHVRPDRRGDVAFEILLGAILGELLELVDDALFDRPLLLARPRERVAHHARLERAFLAVERGAPWKLGARRVAPRTMGPDDAQIGELEGRRLRVGDVRLALLVGEDPAPRRD